MKPYLYIYLYRPYEIYITGDLNSPTNLTYRVKLAGTKFHLGQLVIFSTPPVNLTEQFNSTEVQILYFTYKIIIYTLIYFLITLYPTIGSFLLYPLESDTCRFISMISIVTVILYITISKYLKGL